MYANIEIPFKTIELLFEPFDIEIKPEFGTIISDFIVENYIEEKDKLIEFLYKNRHNESQRLLLIEAIVKNIKNNQNTVELDYDTSFNFENVFIYEYFFSFNKQNIDKEMINNLLRTTDFDLIFSVYLRRLNKPRINKDRIINLFYEYDSFKNIVKDKEKLFICVSIINTFKIIKVDKIAANFYFHSGYNPLKIFKYVEIINKNRGMYIGYKKLDKMIKYINAFNLSV